MKTKKEVKRILKAIKNGQDWESEDYQLIKFNDLYYLTDGWPLPFEDYIAEVSNGGYSDNLIDEEPGELGYKQLDDGTYLNLDAELIEVKLFNKETIKRAKVDNLEHLYFNNWINKFNYYPIETLHKEELKLKNEIKKYEIFISGFSNYKDVARVRTMKKQIKWLLSRENQIKEYEERLQNGR